MKTQRGETPSQILQPRVLPLSRLLPLVRRLRRQKRTIAFTNGCFDLLHVGHLESFERIKRRADCLIVGVNSDSSVQRLKGPRRPLVPARQRARLVAALKAVDYATIFSETTPLKLIRAIRPDLLAKGGDWSKEKIVGRAVVEASGGRVWATPFIEGHSTSRLVPLFFRVVDANLNRAREGLRVCEEVARLILGDPGLTRRCQKFRYELATAAKGLSPRDLLEARDADRDVGHARRRAPGLSHRGYRDLVTANAKRVEEALRVLEEFSRLRSSRSSKAFGALRFRVYTLEQDLLSKLSTVRHR